jgi:tryptophanyl-tRNA synthetase
VIEALRPLQERYRELTEDPSTIEMVLASGAERAAAVANVTLRHVKEAAGLL